MNSKQAYRITYQLYRRSLRDFPQGLTRQQIIRNINLIHMLQPKAAAAAHTSFSMRGLFAS